MRSVDAVGLVRDVLGDDVLVVAGVGRSAYCALRHWPGRTLPVDALGDVLPLALGLAVGLGPRARLVSLEGDGSFLFGLTGLTTLAMLGDRLASFTAVVLDNDRYESAGGLPSRHFPLDWAALAAAFRLRFAQAGELDEVPAAARTTAPVGLLRLMVHDDGPLPAPTRPENGRETVHAFRAMLAARYEVALPVAALKF